VSYMGKMMMKKRFFLGGDNWDISQHWYNHQTLWMNKPK
jgi:hypothetical protein